MLPPRLSLCRASLWLALVFLTSSLAMTPLLVGATETDKPYGKLKWDDFQGPAPTTEGIDAEAVSGVASPRWATEAPTGSGSNWKVKLKVTCKATFDKKQSGVRPGTETDELLEHEQYHFDISEYWAREMQKALEAIEGTGGTQQEAVDDAADKAEAKEAEMDKKCEDLQEKYDDETDHSRDEDKQEEWCKKIGDLLNPPKPKDNKAASNEGTSNFNPIDGSMNFGPLFIQSLTQDGLPVFDPTVQNANLEFPILEYSGNHMGPMHPLLMPPEGAALFVVRSQSGDVIMQGQLLLLMGSDPDTTYTAWIEQVFIDPVLSNTSLFLQAIQTSLATGQSVIGLQVSFPNAPSLATNQWTSPAFMPATVTLGTTFCDPSEPPIVVQPASHSVPVDGSTMFFVMVPAAGPFTYQWSRDGVPLVEGGRFSGTQSDTLRIENAELGDAGDYDVVVTSDCGISNSDLAALAVATGLPGWSGIGALAVAVLLAATGLIALARREEVAALR